MFRELWGGNRGEETKEIYGRRRCEGHTGDMLLKELLHDRGRTSLRNSSPWAAPTGAETSPGDCCPQATHVREDENSMEENKKQGAGERNHYALTSLLHCPSTHQTYWDRCVKCCKNKEGGEEVLDWSWDWERRRKGDSFIVCSIVYLYFFLF